MSAIEHCRTAALGGHGEACEDCGQWRIAYNSCRNRHCPKCQGAAARTWLAEREADLLPPVGYFHVVFTLPAEVADIAFHNKALVYDLLFRAASETMLTIAADPKHLGARIGITAVLHTWGSAMTHHPHVHMIVPGGGIAPDGSRWISSRPAFLLPVRVLAKLFRRGTGIVGYNVQMAVDAEHHLIVAHEVTNIGSDRAQLTSMGQRARDATGCEEITVLADRGYYNGDEVLACEGSGVLPCIPKTQTSGNAKRGLFTVADFIYDAENDRYTCPAGEYLTKGKVRSDRRRPLSQSHSLFVLRAQTQMHAR
jgi:hypothetical protein